MSQLQPLELLREGVSAAKSGDKARARNLLREAIAADPRNENAWLWLAGVTEEPSETAKALERALQINPGNERARLGLAGAILSMGVTEAKANRREQARSQFRRVCDIQPGNENAWLWLASVTDDADEAISHLEQVLVINPNNDRAKGGIQHFRSRRNTVPTPSAIPAARAPAQPAVVTTRKTPEPQRRPEPVPAKPKASDWFCPLCQTKAETRFATCPGCRAVLDLSQAEAALGNPHVDVALVQAGMARLAAIVQVKPEYSTHYYLGMALLNLRRPAEALTHLRASCSLSTQDPGLAELVGNLEKKLSSNTSQPDPKPQQQTILVVDDSPTIRKLVGMTMVKNGFRVFEASDGNEALERIQAEGKPDLVLLDITMPGMDGYALCKAIRQNPKTAKVPVIMLSGKDGFFNKMRGRMAGSDQYLTKPFQPEALVKVVRQYCPATK